MRPSTAAALSPASSCWTMTTTFDLRTTRDHGRRRSLIDPLPGSLFCPFLFIVFACLSRQLLEWRFMSVPAVG